MVFGLYFDPVFWDPIPVNWEALYRKFFQRIGGDFGLTSRFTVKL